MDRSFINSVYDTLVQYQEFDKYKPQYIKNLIMQVSHRLLQDTHKIDTLTVVKICCAMNNVKVKNDVIPSKVFIRAVPYTINLEESTND